MTNLDIFLFYFIYLKIVNLQIQNSAYEYTAAHWR